MTKIKKKFSLAQRYHMVRLFTDEFVNHYAYNAMGNTMKSLMQDAIRFWFVPRLKVTDDVYPPMEVGEVVKKDGDGNIIEEKYVFEVKLTVPVIDGTEIVITKEIKKNALDTVI